MISPEDIKILHLPLAWWKRDELCLDQLEIKLFQVCNIHYGPWGRLRMWATHFWWNDAGEDSRASTSSPYLWVSSEELYWIHILHLPGGSSWLSQDFCSLAFSNQFYTCMYIHIKLYVIQMGFGEEFLKVGGNGGCFPLDTGCEHGTPALSASPKGLEWVWLFYLL